MRKLRVVLVLLCAMLLSVGLFACTKKPKPEEPGKEDGVNIDSITDVSTISLTDSDTEATFNAKFKEITVTYRAGTQRGLTLKGEDCTYTGKIDFQKVGAYTIVVKPTKNNAKGQTCATTVVISHDFGEPVNGVYTCKHDGARKTQSTEDLILHFGDFHSGTTAKVPESYEETQVVTNKAQNSNITAFGTVKALNGDVDVPTLSVGNLEPGTTITVRGYAKTSYEQWGIVDNAYYYFPVIGVADPYMNNAVWEGATHKNYVGGTSVFVRGEGWVLYNGVGDTTKGPRMLASLAGGQSETINYGSHENAFASDTNPVPNGYVNGNMPAPNSPDWKDWWVYSAGDTCNSGDQYGDETPIELTWNYREDGIIELIYNYNYTSATNARKLTCYIKVPTATRGFYRTMLHGDYVDMTIESFEKIETLTPTEFEYKGMEDGTVFFEGQMLDAGLVKSAFKYQQTGDAWQPYSLTVDNVYATTDTTVTDESVWVSLGERPMSVAYKNFKIELEKGGKTFTAVIPSADIKIVANAIGEAFGANGNGFTNNQKVGSFTLGTNGTDITLALAGVANFAQEISAQQATALNITGDASAYKYVSLRLTNNTLAAFGTTDVSVKSGTADVPYLLTEEGGELYLVLALTQETANAGVIVEGIQNSKVVIGFNGLRGFTVTSSIELTSGSGKLNEGGVVSVTFTAVEGTEITHIQIDGGTAYPVSTLLNANIGDEGDYKDGLELAGTNKTIKSFTKSGSVITMTVAFGVADLKNYKAGTVSAVVNGQVEASEEINYVFDFAENVTGDNGAVIGEGGYSFVENGKLYIVAVGNASKFASAPVAFPLNINAGDLNNVRLLDLGFAMEYDEFVFTDAANIPEGVSISYQTAGTNAIVIIEIDVAKLGFTAEYGFQPFYNAGKTYFAVANGKVTVKEIANTGDKRVIVPGNCIDGGIAAYEVKNGNDVVFYLTPASIGGEHKDNNGVCELCGATITENKTFAKPGWFVSSWQDNTYIADGVYYEFIGVYEKATATTKGMTILLDGYNGNTWYEGYRVAGDGYGHHVLNNGSDGWGTLTDPYFDNEEFGNGKSNFTSSVMTEEHPYNTIEGVLDPDGNAITSSSLVAAMTGGTFRYTVSRLNGIIDIRVRLYKEGVAMTGTPFYDYTFSVVMEENRNYKPVFTFFEEKCSVKNGTVNIVKGTIVNSVLAGAEAKQITFDGVNYNATELTFGKVGMNGGFATIAVNGMAQKAEGTLVAGKDYTHYAAFTLNFKQALVESTKVSIAGVEDAKIALGGDRKTVNVFVPFKEGVNLTTATISFENFEASTLQCDIKVDLSAIVVSEITATANADALYLNKGSFTVTYTGGTLTDNMLVSVNGGAKKALSELGDMGAVTAVKNGNAITFTVNSVDFTKALAGYTVTLSTAEGSVLAETFVSAVKLDAAETIDNDVLVVANGNKLAFVFPNLASGTTQDFYLNANNGAAMADKSLLDNYNLTFTLSADGKLSFAERNLLRTATTAVYSKLGSIDVVALTVDLTDLGIAADAAYGFEAKIGAKDVAYRTVAANRTITALTVNASATAVEVVKANCSQDGISAKAVEASGSATFYYGIEVTKGEHKFPADGGLCTVCEDVTGWKVENVQVGKTDNSQGWITEHGANKGYNPAAEERFSTVVAGQKVVAEGRVTAITANNYNGIAALLYKGSEFPANSHIRIDNWINGGPNPQTDFDLPDSDFHIVKTSCTLNGSANVNWATVNNIKANGNITLTWDWTDTSKVVVTFEVVGITTEGTYKQVWTYTAQGGKTLGEKLSIGIFPDSGSFTGTITATASKDAVAAADCNPVKHTHVYSEETDRCPDDNVLNPNHVHDYNATTGLCKCGEITPEHTHNYVNGLCQLCGAVCAHKDQTGETCTVCGATLITDVSYDNPVAFTTWYEVPETVAKGEKLVIYGTQDTDIGTNWDTVYWEIKEGYTGRLDNWGWTFNRANFDQWINNTDGGAGQSKGTELKIVAPNGLEVVGDPFVNGYGDIAKKCNWRMEFSWLDNGNVAVNISLTATEGAKVGYTFKVGYELNVLNADLNTISVHLTASAVKNFTVTGIQKVTNA